MHLPTYLFAKVLQSLLYRVIQSLALASRGRSLCLAFYSGLVLIAEYLHNCQPIAFTNNLYSLSGSIQDTSLSYSDVTGS